MIANPRSLKKNNKANLFPAKCNNLSAETNEFHY